MAGDGEYEPTPAIPLSLYWQLIREKIPLFILTVFSCLITLAAQRVGGAVMPLTLQTPWGPHR